jgi:hypothetical protein
MKRQLIMLMVSCISAFYSTVVVAQDKKPTMQQLRSEFSQPSAIARTKLWWFHGETETTKEGITADLVAFKREGVGGVVYYDQQHGKGENAFAAFTPIWWDMFRFAAREAKRLGLTFETHLSNGYVSGGPWITEELSMQRLEATDTLVNGGQHLNSKLPVPFRKNQIRVYWGMTLAQALTMNGIKPDAGFKSGNTITDKVYFAHRRFGDHDIYFFNNHSKNIFRDSIRLRTNAIKAEYWDPTSGKQFSVPISAAGKDGLLVNIVLQPDESGFIVTSKEMASSLPPKLSGIGEQSTSIDGDWKVFFDPKWGGPGEVTFNKLTDWTQHPDQRIKFYSGTAVYRKIIQCSKLTSGEQVLLRFPQLGSVARVVINGKEVSTVWCSPWEADLTAHIKKGGNTVEIYVANCLTNRMIADALLPQSERFTYAYPEIASPKDRLIASGIIDKVLLVKRSK